MRYICAGLFLLMGSCYDCKKLLIPRWLIGVGGLGGIICSVYMVCSGRIEERALLCSLMPGVFSIMISRLTKEQIGYGDGLVLLALGGYLGGKRTIYVWIIGLWISFIISIILLVLRKGTKRTRLPFVPFLFLGFLVVLLGGE